MGSVYHGVFKVALFVSSKCRSEVLFDPRQPPANRLPTGEVLARRLDDKAAVARSRDREEVVCYLGIMDAVRRVARRKCRLLNSQSTERNTLAVPVERGWSGGFASERAYDCCKPLW